MPELKLVPLDELLPKKQQKRLCEELAELGIDELPDSEGEAELEEPLAEEPFGDFMDRLEAADLACDIFLPVEFEGVVELGAHVIGSAYSLQEALEDMREDLGVDAEKSDEDEEDLDLEVVEEQLRFVWRVFLRAVNTCIDRQVPLHVIH